jgi:2-dehydropantoate 2-reductase
MRVAVVGAGAIGGRLAIPLAAQGHEISVLARGATLSALQQRPWKLTRGDEVLEAMVRASSDAADLGEQDVVIIAVKGPALATVAPLVRPMIGPATTVIPAMNGVPWWFLLHGGGELPPTSLTSVDPDGTIAEAIPLDRVLGCVVHLSAASVAPGEVGLAAGNRIFLGEPAGGTSPRLEEIAEHFRAAGFDVTASDRIQKEIWYKLWGNMTMNPISALTRATCDRILDDPLVNKFVLGVMGEAQEIGRRVGCVIQEGGKDRMAVTRRLGPIKTSMLRDVEANRPIELEDLLGAPSEIARMLGAETPSIDALFGLTRLFGRSTGLYPDS